MNFDGGLGSDFDLPKYDLYAQDYLEFADLEMQKYLQDSGDPGKTGHLINCVAHLRRAIDCQLDAFLHAINVQQYFKKRKLGFPSKLEFIRTVGVFNARSLNRLNSLRNKMEHDFEAPIIQDIDIYYDLSAAFVAILQRTLSMSKFMDLDFVIDNGNTRNHFSIEYIFETPAIKAGWKTENETIELVVGLNNFQEFTFFLKSLFLLIQKDSFTSNRYILSQLEKE